MAHVLGVPAAHTMHAGPARARRLQTGALEPDSGLAALDPTRILAESGAIAVHAAALLLLLAPLNPEFIPPAANPEEALLVVPVRPHEPPPPPPAAEPVRPATPPVPPPVPPRSRIPPPVLDPLPGDTSVEARIADAVAGSPAVPAPRPVAGAYLEGAYLEYEEAPPPAYPREAMRRGLTGRVVLRVLVGIDGRPIDVQIGRSSGHRLLDLAAKRQVRAKWRFKPAVQDGRLVQATGLVPIDFTLDR